jgi:hypothetical protein
MAASELGFSHVTGFNPMFIAAEQGHTDVVHFFLDQGADVHNDEDSPWSGETEYTSCLVAAAAGGNPQLLRLLLEDYGMALEPDWAEAMEAGVTRGHAEAVQGLLSAAADEGGDGGADSTEGQGQGREQHPGQGQEDTQVQVQVTQQQGPAAGAQTAGIPV